MKSLKLSFIYFLVFPGLFLITGCSASSNSTRYGDTSNDSSSGSKTNIRFSSVDDDKSDKSRNVDKSNNEITKESDGTDVDGLPANEPKVDISSVLKNINSSPDKSDFNSNNSTPKERMLMEIIKYINTPYKYGGASSSGIDCSAFTQSVYNRAVDVSLRRTAGEQYQEGEEIDNVDDLKFGDLVFFNTQRRVRPGHVGIYIGDHLFAHASKSGVIVSTMDMDYYAKRFMGGRRIEQGEFSSK